MSDPTENARRELQVTINAEQAEREKLEAEYGRVWTTTELQEEFEALGFAAPFIIVRRKSDKQKGTLMFQHSPRFYFNWQPC